jgi:hypothetical protein
MKILTAGAVAGAMALSVTSASAQMTILNSPIPPSINSPVAPPTSSVFGADPIVRISTTFRIVVATKDTESLNDVKAQETGRRTLYGMAEGECAILSEIFQAECRLNSFTITSLAVNLPPTSMMAATAIYELKPAWQASGR